MSELIWPVVDDYDSPRQTSRYGAAWAWVLGGLAFIAAILAGNLLFCFKHWINSVGLSALTYSGPMPSPAN